LGQGVMSLGLLMSGEGKFLPPKLSLLLQLAASASLSQVRCLTMHFIWYSHV
jgi:hypothetical protein